ncbi:MAG TPA: FecR domain-containing protein, partial [Polyangiaceae bacterium]
MKSDPSITERALRRVLAEARAETTPELDWERIEARLDNVEQLGSPDVVPPRGGRSRTTLLLAAAGLALALGWVAAGGRTPMSLPVATDAPRQALDGDTLSAGSRIDATTAEVAVEHARHSRWTLERGGRATVTSGGGVVRVELEAGALFAQVTPSNRKETFVVEAAGTRVAVHGTAFRVALTADHVDVAVTEGTVLVGPRDMPGSGRALTAHESSSFTLSGAPIESERTASLPVSHKATDRRGVATPGRARELAQQPSIDEVEKVVSQVLELGANCFESRTATANGVRVTASTMITLRAL